MPHRVLPDGRCQGERVPLNLVGVKSPDGVTAGNGDHVDEVDQRVYLVERTALEDASAEGFR